MQKDVSETTRLLEFLFADKYLIPPALLSIESKSPQKHTLLFIYGNVMNIYIFVLTPALLTDRANFQSCVTVDLSTLKIQVTREEAAY